MNVPESLLAGGVAQAASALAAMAVDRRVKRADWKDDLRGLGQQAGKTVSDYAGRAGRAVADSAPVTMIKDRAGAFGRELAKVPDGTANANTLGLYGAGIGAAVGGIGGALTGRYGPRDRSPWRSGLTGAIAGAGLGGGLGYGVPTVANALSEKGMVRPDQIEEANNKDLHGRSMGTRVVDSLGRALAGAADPKGEGLDELVGEGAANTARWTGDAVHDVARATPGVMAETARLGGESLTRPLPQIGLAGGGIAALHDATFGEQARLGRGFRAGSNAQLADGKMPAVGSDAAVVRQLRDETATMTAGEAGRAYQARLKALAPTPAGGIAAKLKSRLGVSSGPIPVHPYRGPVGPGIPLPPSGAGGLEGALAAGGYTRPSWRRSLGRGAGRLAVGYGLGQAADMLFRRPSWRDMTGLPSP